LRLPPKKQERLAKHDADKTEQMAKGQIEKQKIENLKKCESERNKLVMMQTEVAAIQSTGTAKAEAEAKAAYLKLEGEADVKQAELQAKASNIEAKALLLEKREEQKLEIEHKQSLVDLEIDKSKRLAKVETDKFKALVVAIKPETIKAIARAGPEIQARLLKGLGLKGYLMTDGNSPINLFNAAKGMVSPNFTPGGNPGMGGM
jgi:major vault protein